MDKIQPKILVISGEHDDLKALKTAVIKYMPKARILTARDSRLGYEKARAEDADVILVDQAIALADDFSLSRNDKGDAYLQGIPTLIIMDSLSDGQLREKALKAGADGFIYRPYDDLELFSRLQIMARLKAAQRHAQAEEKHHHEELQHSIRDLRQEMQACRDDTEILRKNEQRLQSIFRVAPTGIGLVKDRVILDVNDRLCTMTGYLAEELIGKNSRFLYPTRKEFDYVGKVKYDMIGREGTGIVETLWRKKDGSIIDVLLASTAVNPADLSKGVTFTALDITASKQMAKDLEKSRQSYLDIFNTVSEAIYIQDETGAFIDVNRGAELMYGFSREELIGQTPLTVGAPDKNDYDELGRLIQQVFKTGRAVSFEFWGRRKNGEIFPKEVIVNKGTYFGKEVLIATARDISARKKTEEALRESEEKLRTLFETMAQGVVYQEADGQIISANPAAERILGLSLAQMQNRTSFDPRWQSIRPDGSTFPGDQHPSMEALRTGKAIHNTIMGVYNPLLEAYRWINIHAVPEFLPDADKPYRVYTTFEDITERLRTENDLKETNRQLSTLLANLPGMSYRCENSPDWPMSFISDGCNALTGYRPAELQVNNPAYGDLIIPEDRQMVWDSVQSALDVHRPFELHYRISTVEGKLKWVWERGRGVFDEQGKILFLEGFISDITERKKAEEALRESEEKFRTLIQQSHDAIYLLNGDQFEIINSSFTELFGYDRAEIHSKGFNFRKLVAPKSLPFIENRVARLNRGERVEPLYEFTAVAKDGREIQCETSVSYIDYKGGTAALGVIRDITLRRQAEEERDRLRAQLTQAQKMESVGRLAGGVAHDFNNMLGVIIGRAELAMQRLESTHPLYEDLQEIRKAAERSANLTRQLLAFARKQTIAPRVLDLNETVEGMLKMLRRLIGEDITLTWMPKAELWPVKVDPSQIDQILANLCVNARDAITGVGKITIETDNVQFDEEYCSLYPSFNPGEYVLLTISDNGCGMDKDTLDKLFEPFFTTKSPGKGTGLGLATVYGIVKQNNGFINVYSEPGKGSNFKIYLPRYVRAPERQAKEQAEPPAPRGNETILLVEDELAILNMAKTMLEGLGYTVLSANSPREAIRIAKKHSGAIHLLMTDVIMPEMNGRELAVKLSALYANLKSLYISGYTADVIAHHGVLDEGVYFIQKPFSLRNLAARVREALNEQ